MSGRGVRHRIPVAMLAVASLTVPGSADILLAASPGTSPGIDSPERFAGAEWLSLISLVLAPVSIALLLGWRRRWRREGGLIRGTPWRLPAGPSLLFFAIGVIGGGIAVGLVPAAWLAADASPLREIAIAGWVATIGSLLLCTPAIPIWRRTPEQSDATPPLGIGRAIRFGALGLLVALPLIEVGAIAGQYLQQLFSETTPELVAHEILDALVREDRDAWWWLIAANAVVGAPVIEELLYRGFLQQGFRMVGTGTKAAVFLTSAIFALMHYPILPEESVVSAMTALFLLSIALGAIRERTGRIVPCMIAHGMFNAFNLGLAVAFA